ncbi:MAG TPA: hypothetical protein V6C95_20060 [Coleofasciculaceae cyanobacterium]
MAAKKSNKSKKAQKPKESSPAPGANKLNLVALKPQEKQLDAVPEVVEPEAPIVAPIEQTATAVPTPKELPTTTPAQGASNEQGYGQNLPFEMETVGASVERVEFANSRQPTPNTLTPHLNQDQPRVSIPSEQELIAPFPNDNAMFQGIGVIVGTVTLKGKNQCQVIISDKQYPLVYRSKFLKPYKTLEAEIEKTGNQQHRLIVYPQARYFGSHKQLYQLSFSLVDFDRPRRTNGVVGKLDDFQFKLCGFWQFIPACPIPCISVYKNFDSWRISYIKKATPQHREQFLKANHVPVIWEEAPVKPFKYNPQLEKDQQEHAFFVEIIAQFLPEKDAFRFIQLCSKPSQTAPRFFQMNRENPAQPKIKTIH